MEEEVPIFKGAGCTVTADGYVFADDLALFPLVVRGEDLGDADLRRALLAGDGVVIHLGFGWLLAEEVHLHWVG